ncbi:MAG: hypothetical protein XD76_0851 [candidate division TA06 bacterium 32_111]|uniref:Uncharacterized protein n=2 Tax=Bacteria candidate phyla TaxID=1783234 RepID=A0A117M782_UNCT6|nr:MAG: hypothetical protein XD76_0851 [candidate division TA06 bacterium 32_111]KUK88197.1 MAG: hypothetical protein XE03_0203 [candidate division TA06 bacterium 34_109]HAF07130.1 hypothetical protein [candidate division WOR-3 bacterium]HCP16085.1 hypothetical protein [candidate division WOR-3 bacterium]
MTIPNNIFTLFDIHVKNKKTKTRFQIFCKTVKEIRKKERKRYCKYSKGIVRHKILVFKN